MKNILTYLLFLPFATFGQSYDVLFLGNSYTSFNNLPQLVSDIANSMGDTVNFDSNTPGGATFNAHSTNATTLSKISQNEWDFVVLQAQSQEPSFSPGQVANDVYPYAQILIDSIAQNSSCTEPLFYMTWGRKYGDQQNCVAYPPICTYEGMQDRLRKSYLEMATTHNASASPVGIAWKNAMTLDSTIELYTTDNSHPSLLGSYLAACTFYSSIFKKSSVGSTSTAGIDSATAVFLQTVASSTVLDSLIAWNIFNAGFSNVVNGSTVTLTNTSSNYESLFWDFGDGNQSTDPNPTHTYAASGSYTVTLTTQNNSNCWVDTVSKVITIVALPMTYVPDDNFEQALIGLGYDTGIPDDSVPTVNIENLTYLSVNNQSIADLTGIEDFIALEQLYCGLNQLTALDISQNAALMHLDVRYNDLGSFNISNNPSLLSVYCTGNQLTHIEVGAAPLLYSLECESNQLQDIDVSGALALEVLDCQNNLITSLDLSSNLSLAWLRCASNQLYCLNIQNTNIIFTYPNDTNFVALDNPNLSCIEVDDLGMASNWNFPLSTHIDSTATFSLDCSYPTPCDSVTSNIIPPINCSLLEVADVAIDDSSMTIDITIYNGDTVHINYPYIGLVVDAIGDTIQNGSSWIFVQFAGDSVIYSYTLNSVSPDYPVTVYLAYSDMAGGMGTDTCVLSYAAPVGISETPTKPKKLLNIYDLLGSPSLPVPNQILLYKYSDGSVEKRIQLDR